MTIATGVVAGRRPAWWLLWASLAVHLVLGAVAVRTGMRPHADIDNYYEIGMRPGRPYVDFAVEFPVATAQTFRTLAPLAGSRPRFGAAVVAVSVLADAAIAGALAWGWGIEAAACYAFITIPLLDLFFLRMDLWPTALTAAGAAAWRRDRPAAAAVAFVAGAAFKLWPIVFLPLLLVPVRRRVGPGPLVTAFVAGCAVLAGWLWVAGFSGLYQVLTFRGARGWEVESTVGAVWMVLDRSTARLESGAWRIGTTSGPISIALFALGAIPCVWMIWRGARAGRLGAGWLGGISALLVTSALLSPQYAAWMAPAGGVAWAEKDRRSAVLTGLAVFVTNLVFKSFVPLLRGAPRALVLVNARNLFLAWIAFDVGRRLIRKQGSATR